MPVRAHHLKGAQMTQLELTAEEAEALKSALEDYLSDLRMEIVDTDSQDFREQLKARKETLMRIRERLR